jgi:hypothetical protein
VSLPKGVSDQHVCKATFRTDCPSLIQERVRGKHELRVFHLLGQLMALRVRVAESDYVDIRLVPPSSLDIEAVEPPVKLARAIRRYCVRRQLAYRALDFITTADGRNLLIDVNPSGSWSHMERAGNSTVTRWMAEVLARRAARVRRREAMRGLLRTAGEGAGPAGSTAW